MVPYCDAMDGPVVTAARRALEKANVNLVLPWMREDCEEDLRTAFQIAAKTRNSGNTPQVTQLVDLWFCETAVRLFQQGEKAPYTGLKPSGFDEGPIIPLADKALETRNADELIQFLTDSVREELQERFEKAVAWQGYDENDIAAGRRYVQAMLGFVLYVHELVEYLKDGERDKSKTEKPLSRHDSEIIKKARKLGHSHRQTEMPAKA